MQKLKLTKVIASTLIVASVLALNPNSNMKLRLFI